MKFKNIVPVLFLILVSAASLSAQQNLPEGKEAAVKSNNTDVKKGHKVIMQLMSADTLAHKTLINQIKTLKTVWGDSVLIEVVVHGPGIEFLMEKKSKQKESIAKLRLEKVRFMACENTMKQKNLNKGDIISGIDMIPFGLVEIITKQEEGWSYIKAGF